jgi:maltooligosyltrehalose trehalohydrolase
MRIGAYYNSSGSCEFTVWAPFLQNVQVRILQPKERILPTEKDSGGYWRAEFEAAPADVLYYYRLNNTKDRPDPASQFQPEGVHGPSQVLHHSSFEWTDNHWKGLPLSKMIIYELHVGTFTPEGTFDAVRKKLPYLRALGINALEIMPVAQFPGERNWGYDGVYPFAVQKSYGGPEGFKKLVNACHNHEMAVILDVVYNHLGPEGNYLGEYGPYFTDKYRTSWGLAINFDSAHSNEVRNYFIENALFWFRDYHIDALRLDAIHGITDFSAQPFLQELADAAHKFSDQIRPVYLIAESDLNDTRIIKPKKSGGYGIHAQWCDDFHHSLHTLLTGEKDGYYADFGSMRHMIKTVKEGFVYSGEYSDFRKRDHGNSSKGIPADKFIVFSQNHDQIGNRAFGDRLTSLVSFESLKLAAGMVIFSPYIPLLFMGEEYGEDTPFLYFVSHGDRGLIEAVRKGRREEFKEFTWKVEPPDPQDVKTFERSKMLWKKKDKGKHKVLLQLYQALIQMRKHVAALSHLDKACLHIVGSDDRKLLIMKRWKDKSEVHIVSNFSNVDREVTVSLSKSPWKKILDTSEDKWLGPGTLLPDWVTGGKQIIIRKQSMAVYLKEDSA